MLKNMERCLSRMICALSSKRRRSSQGARRARWGGRKCRSRDRGGGSDTGGRGGAEGEEISGWAAVQRSPSENSSSSDVGQVESQDERGVQGGRHVVWGNVWGRRGVGYRELREARDEVLLVKADIERFEHMHHWTARRKHPGGHAVERITHVHLSCADDGVKSSNTRRFSVVVSPR